MPYARLADWRTGLQWLRSMEFRLLAPTPNPAATPIGQIEADGTADGKLALLIGGEGDGLAARWLAAAEQNGPDPDEQARRLPQRRLSRGHSLLSASWQLTAPPLAGS